MDRQTLAVTQLTNEVMVQTEQLLDCLGRNHYIVTDAVWYQRDPDDSFRLILTNPGSSQSMPGDGTEKLAAKMEEIADHISFGIENIMLADVTTTLITELRQRVENRAVPLRTIVNGMRIAGGDFEAVCVCRTTRNIVVEKPVKVTARVATSMEKPQVPIYSTAHDFQIVGYGRLFVRGDELMIKADLPDDMIDAGQTISFTEFLPGTTTFPVDGNEPTEPRDVIMGVIVNGVVNARW